MLIKYLQLTLIFSMLTLIGGAQEPSLKKLKNVISTIKQYHVHPQSNDLLEQKAIKGLLEQLDPHSTFIQVEDLKKLNQSQNGIMGGIGIEVTVDKGLLKVVTSMDDTPAHRAGIKTGDIITHVDHKLIHKIGYQEAIDRIRGKVGSPVTLKILSVDKSKHTSVTLTRELIQLTSVKTKMLNSKIAYIRISLFNKRTQGEIRQAIKKLMTQEKQLSSIIIDVRNNPGGSLKSVVATTNLFLNKSKLKYQGRIVSYRNRYQKAPKAFYANGHDITKGIALTVLVNQGSASAAEILAAALKEHERAIIVGERTFGKGSIQSVIEIDQNQAIKLTTATYTTPSGHEIQQQGVEPNINIPNYRVSEINQNSYTRETQLIDSVNNTTNTKQTIGTTNHLSQDFLALQTLYLQDFQLYLTAIMMQDRINHAQDLTNS